jgi:hypothetical protein
MSFGGPSKSCPRCNTVLPAQATFCGTCGFQFSAPATPGVPPASNYGAPTQYAGPGAPGSWPQSQPQPGYAPPSQPGYGSYSPAGQPGYPGYPGAPVMTPPKKGGASKAIILVLVLVVLVGGGAAAWFLYLSPGRCAGPLFDRHNQPSNIPMPSGCSFAGENHESSTIPGTPTQQAKVDEWAWTVSGSDPATVAQFYKDKLPGQGWSSIKQQTGTGGDYQLLTCQGTQVLEIDTGTKLRLEKVSGTLITIVNAPAGGSALGVALITLNDPRVVQALCTGQVPPA